MKPDKLRAFQKLMATWDIEERINRKALRLDKKQEAEAQKLSETLKIKR